jgi:hypothetical protein
MTAQAKALVACNLIEIKGMAVSFTPKWQLGRHVRVRFVVVLSV